MSHQKRDYYEVLGVSRTATGEEIRGAFKRLAMEHHPDRNPGDAAAEERFKEAAEAYDVLSDEEKRSRYDRFGHGPAFDPFAGFGGAGAGAVNINDIFGEIFGEVFGGGRRPRGRPRGSDLRYNLELGFEEAAFGTVARIEIPRPVRCEPCQGSGAKPGTQPRTCPTCKGAGEIRLTQGFFAISRTCSHCNGEGKVIAERCPTCGGKGASVEKATVEVKVPPGVDTGTRLKLRGEGEPAPAPSGEAGDLYVVVQVREHPIFQRHDTEVVFELPVSITQAALGAQVEVPTLDGPFRLRIPAGTQPGKVFKLKGKGIPALGGGGRGDQHVQLQIEIPTKLSKEQREILERFAALSGEETHPKASRFWAKVAELLGK
jgi:molecular chaperone DnaJ